MGTIQVVLGAALAALAAAILAALALAWNRNRSHAVTRTQLAHLLEPRITKLPPLPVLQIVERGDPNVVAREAFALLMRTYFGLRGVPRGGRDMPAPRARWADVDLARAYWTGLYAIPVPDSVTEMPHLSGRASVRVDLTTWEYGDVAEILHVGPYSEEAPTIERLRRFVTKSGYEPLGEHEEEYVKGPTLFGPGNPRHYLTLIRFRIRRPVTSEPERAGAQVAVATRSR